jgi:hypothetical protein
MRSASLCDSGTSVVTAADVLRGLSRFFANGGQRLLGEVPLPNGRRADAVLVDARGTITIIG